MVLLVSRIVACSATPTIYHVDDERNEGQAVMVPVASTVIPLEELPVFSVGLGFGLGGNKNKDKKKKPAHLKVSYNQINTRSCFQIIIVFIQDIQLITAKNQHRFVAAAGVQELSKEEFEQFNVNKK